MDKQLEDRRRLPAIAGREMEHLAAGVCQFAATIIDNDSFAADEKIGAYLHTRATIDDVMKYVSRNYLEAPDVYELQVGLAMLRNMLAERGIVCRDDD